MQKCAFAIFETPVGPCGMIWRDRGIAGVQLPVGSERGTRARIRQRHPDADEAPPPADVSRAIESIVALLNGERRDLSDVPLDFDGISAFSRRVYEAARRIPPGQTLTYGEIAAQIGEPAEAQAVGQALGRNPFVIVVPCHRVLAANGKAGGFSASGGVATKLRLLAIEQARLSGEPPTLFDWAKRG